MLLTITTDHRPATDLGFLLHKNPSRVHSAQMTFGDAHVFYPEANEDRCTVALLLEVDPVKLVRGRTGPSGDGGLFDQYVNDRPYAASSFLSSAMTEFFSTAMSGRSKERQELADQRLPWTVTIPALPCTGGEQLLRALFGPLGYEVEASRLPLDGNFPDWGEGRYFELTLRGTQRLKDLLSHLYVLIPVLDNEKHYWVDKQEIDKLLLRAKEWLPSHPEREQITRKFLRYQKQLTREALARLTAEEGDPDPDNREQENALQENQIERPISLHEQRLKAVLEALKESGARRVLDLGCGEGRLLGMLLEERQFEAVVGMDVSYGCLEKAERRLRLDRMAPMKRARLTLVHGSLVYRDSRLVGYDAAAVVEVIEHLDPPRLDSFERIVFSHARPKTVVVTTPNREYNVLFESMPASAMRHRDHRFEWTRQEFQTWSSEVALRHGYSCRFASIGPEHEEHGAPSQMAVFTREGP